MTEAQIAERIAREAHAGQVDKQGQPYIQHVERVVAAVSEPAKAAAWLHDVLEDTPLEPSDLDLAGITARTVQIVKTLTRWKGEPYPMYIAIIAQSAIPEAHEVKVADIRDNLARFPTCSTCPETMRSRYLKALERLTGEKSVA